MERDTRAKIHHRQVNVVENWWVANHFFAFIDLLFQKWFNDMQFSFDLVDEMMIA